jgi:hypothetical protein
MPLPYDAARPVELMLDVVFIHAPTACRPLHVHCLAGTILTSCPPRCTLCCAADQFIPLDPINSTIGVHQRLDIYPGISTGGTPILSLGRQWNDFFLVAPTPADVVAIYGQGRADAIWWITHNFANNPTVLSAVANSIDNTLLTRANLDALQSTLPAPPPGLLG